MSEANKAVAQRWFDEVWNQGRQTTVYELFPAPGVARGLGETEADVNGPEEFCAFSSVIRGAIPGPSHSNRRLHR